LGPGTRPLRPPPSALRPPPSALRPPPSALRASRPGSAHREVSKLQVDNHGRLCRAAAAAGRHEHARALTAKPERQRGSARVGEPMRPGDSARCGCVRTRRREDEKQRAAGGGSASVRDPRRCAAQANRNNSQLTHFHFRAHTPRECQRRRRGRRRRVACTHTDCRLHSPRASIRRLYHMHGWRVELSDRYPRALRPHGFAVGCARVGGGPARVVRARLPAGHLGPADL
jgi:hypothetical protein